jgi:hypothetical protein
MKKKSTNRFLALGIPMFLSFLFTLLSYSGSAQVSLVEWVGFSSGPPVIATSSLVMNNGKQLTNSGQSSAFVSDLGSGPVFIANGWSIGNYYQANFSTINYSTNTITFFLGAFQFGAKNFKLQYATGSPTTFTDFGAAISFPSAGGQNTFTYSLPAACNNQTNVYIRITATSASTASGGGDFLDDVEVTGFAMTAPSITTQPLSSTICEGADATFSLVANNAISYQWQFRTSAAGTFANCPNNATYDNETTAALTVNNVTAAMSGYQFRCIVTGGTTPDATSNTVTMTVNSYGTWNGSVNTNWNNVANWNCGQVPDATINVTINSGGNQPVVNITNAVCNNITINSGATLTFSGTTNVLDIKGAVSGAGTLNGTLGKIIFSGASAQTIPAGTYKDLQMNGSGNKTLGGNVTVTGVLTLTSGTITLGSNNLTLNNTGTTTGANASSFIVTNGTGGLINQNIGAGGKTGNVSFPIGSTTTSYTPMALNNTTGTADNFTAQVKDGIFTTYTGTTGSGAITNNSVNKTWHIAEGTAGGSNANLQLTWNSANELTGFDRDNCKLSHYITTGSWSGGPLTFAVGTDPYTVSRPGITSFSPFVVASGGVPLPLDLLTFTGHKTNNAIALNWTTVNEKFVKNFDVERSTDGNSFKSIGLVAAKNLAEESGYQYNDRTSDLPATVFYRLKMNYDEGKEKYSPVVRITNTTGESVSVYPNPVKDGIVNVQFDHSLTGATVNITDMSGKVVYTKALSSEEIGKGQVSILVRSLANGNYVLNLNTDKGNTITSAKFIKQ